MEPGSLIQLNCRFALVLATKLDTFGSVKIDNGDTGMIVKNNVYPELSWPDYITQQKSAPYYVVLFGKSLVILCQETIPGDYFTIL